jgi:signal transduction histidine kinase
MAIRTAQFQLAKRLIKTLLLALIISAGKTSVSAQDAETNKRVLMLFGDDSFIATQVRIEQALRSTLRNGSSAPVEMYSEYVGNKRATGDYEKELVTLLRRKYEGKKFDVVFSIGQFPLGVLLRNRAELFPGTPFVFVSIDRRNIEQLYPAPGLTGVWGEINFKANLEIALALHPATKRVFVIQGVSEIDKFWAAKAKEDFRAYESRVEFTDLPGLTMPEMRSALAGLPPDSVVFFVSHILDKAGNGYESPEFLRQVSGVSAAPIYGTTEAQLGNGIVGGELLSFEALGAEGGRLGLRLLSGEKPDAIAPHSATKVAIFDWRELQRWGISEDHLPAGSVVRFKELTFWQRYKWRITGALAIIALQTLFIAGLLIERRRRQRARRALAQLNAELEERIAARTADLKAKSRELEAFAYSVAHDLKAPLRGIDGYSRLLVEEHAANLNDDGRYIAQTILSSSEEMSQLIDDLLEYSRLERREFKSSRVELASLITTVVEQKKREAADKPTDFIVKVNGGSVLADANGLAQALRNYLDNAVKFTRKVSHPRIEIGTNESPSGVVIWVRDNGVGFDMKYHDRMFDIFQRLNRSEEYPGTGIGLAIVRKAMERMGGRAWAEGEPSNGATFYLAVPNGSKSD